MRWNLSRLGPGRPARSGRAGARSAVNLSYKLFGEHPAEADEPPVFILHGLLGCKRHWDGVGKTIQSVTKRAVVAVDLRNHGASPHATSHAYEELAEDVAALRRRLAVPRAGLVGHSMGGRAAMCAALLEPQAVAGLLVIDISPVSTSKHLSEYMPKVLAAMKELSFKNEKNVGNAKREARKKLKQVISDDMTMNAVLSNITKKSDHTIGWMCNLDVLIKHFKYIQGFPKSLLKGKEYSGPTLFIGGQLSEYIPPDDLPGVRALFPRAVVTFVPRARHAPHLDDPKSFLELAVHFLKTT